MFWGALILFSHQYCVAICGVLVSVMTGVSLWRLGAVLGMIPGDPKLLLGVLGLAGVLLLLHVFSWWLVGVVMLPTYILPGVVGLYGGFAWGCDLFRGSRRIF
ncbi:MAG: hypothetical protein Q6K99_05835 [Thermostichales cyanobacterium BF4_bins_65]